MTLVQTIRNYSPIRMLGSGGFGVTYLVTDTAPYKNNRQCVLKQFKPAQRLDNETLKDMQRRFSIEANVLRVLSEKCEQIPKLYDEFSENGEFYLVQEYIEGKTLAQKVKDEEKLSEDEVRRILIGLLPVLEQVHAKRMIHRDITPDNVMLRDKDSKPFLIDFGAVKEVIYTIVDSQGAPLDISVVIGKNSYMPQEQKLGIPRFESDLYSLGLTAIHLLTGKSPQEFTRNPSTKAFQWHGHAPKVSEQLKAILDKVTQLEYKDRFRTAKDMLDAIESTVLNTSKTKVKQLTEVEIARRQTQWEKDLLEIERREREAKEAVRQYQEYLEIEFQKDLKRRQEDDAKFKAEVRRKRSERKAAEAAQVKNQQHSRKTTQQPQEQQASEITSIKYPQSKMIRLVIWLIISALVAIAGAAALVKFFR